jgi:Leucine-rich repeat (LRR) protein
MTYNLRNRTYTLRHTTSLLIPAWTFLFFLIISPISLKAQLLDSLSLDTMKEFKSIAEANNQPDQVVKLVIHHQRFNTIPEDIRKYTHLQYLDLSKNHVKIVPSWIGELTSLQTLILSKNSIDTLPPEIGNLMNLKYFIINRTELASLPPEIGNLKELLYLDVYDDNLDDFPIDLDKLTKLRVLDLRDVSINDDEQAVIKSYLPHAIIFFSPGCQCRE